MKLDMGRRSEIEREIICGIRDAIAAHGPVTGRTVASAAKRVVGRLKALARSLEATIDVVTDQALMDDLHEADSQADEDARPRRPRARPSPRHYERVAERLRSHPDSPLNLAFRSWIGRFHVCYGQMPPLDLRPDWQRFPQPASAPHSPPKNAVRTDLR